MKTATFLEKIFLKVQTSRKEEKPGKGATYHDAPEKQNNILSTLQSLVHWSVISGATIYLSNFLYVSLTHIHLFLETKIFPISLECIAATFNSCINEQNCASY